MERYVLIDTMKYHPLDLEKYSEAQDDEELVGYAVKKNGLALQYASERLRDDYQTVLTAVNKNGLALQFASEKLRDDYQMVLAAVKQNGVSLEFASDKLKHNSEIVWAAVESNAEALSFIPDELKSKEIVLEAIANTKERDSDEHLEAIPDHFYSDKEIVSELIQIHPYTIASVSDELAHDVELIKQAVEKDATALEFVPDDLLCNKEIALKIVSVNASALYYFSEDLKNDKEVILAAMNAPYNTYAYEILKGKMQSDVDVLRAFVANIDYEGTEYFSDLFDDSLVPDELIEDDTFVLRVISIFDESEGAFCELTNKKFILRAIELSCIDSEFISSDLLDDPDIQNALQKYEIDDECDDEEW